jgi:hypothetical protein
MKKITIVAISILAILAIAWVGCSQQRSVERKVVAETAPSGAINEPPPSPEAPAAEASKDVAKARAGYSEERGVSVSTTVPAPPTSGEVPPPEMVNIELQKPPTTTAPKIIYKGNVKVKVGNLDEGVTKLREMVANYGGTIMEVHSTFRDEESYGEAYITVKVPYKKVQDFVADLGGLGKVEDSQMTSEDVTLQWYDIQKDVERRKIELEEKYLEFQKDPKNYAKKQEYLRLYNIYLDQSKRAAQLAYDAENSTVVITLVSYPDLWVSALNIGLKILYYIFIVVLVLLPCAGLTLLIIWFIRLLLRLRKPKKV